MDFVVETPMQILLDTGILGQLCHPRRKQNQPATNWMLKILGDHALDVRVFLPEIADYELRRKLLHLISKGQSPPKSIDRLNSLGKLLDYLPLDTEVMHHAAELWARCRSQGWPLSSEQALDGDVILAAQAQLVCGTIVTTNRKHLEILVPAKSWEEIVIGPPA
jgi:predicted nucleic acid-binding protein